MPLAYSNQELGRGGALGAWKGKNSPGQVGLRWC